MTKPYGLIADLHLHAWSSFSTTKDGMNSRLAALLSEIDRCAAEVNAAGGDRVYIAGDVFHVRGAVSPTVLNATRDAIQLAADRHCVTFVVMPGNHDLEGKDSTRLSSAVTSLECDSVVVVSTSFLDRTQLLIPWVECIDDLKAMIEKDLPPASRSVIDLILHAPIDGVIKGLPLHGLTPEWLADLGFKRVFAGHYHNHKKFDGGLVYSIGALAHHTWSDIKTKAGFLIVHDDKVVWRKSHLPEFIDLSELVGLEEEEIPLLVDGNFVRVKVDTASAKEVEAARQDLLDMGAKAVLVQSSPKPPVREGLERASVASGESLEVSVSDYVKTLPSVDVPAVVKAALAVLAAVDETGVDA